MCMVWAVLGRLVNSTGPERQYKDLHSSLRNITAVQRTVSTKIAHYMKTDTTGFSIKALNNVSMSDM